MNDVHAQVVRIDLFTCEPQLGHNRRDRDTQVLGYVFQPPQILLSDLKCNAQPTSGVAYGKIDSNSEDKWSVSEVKKLKICILRWTQARTQVNSKMDSENERVSENTSDRHLLCVIRFIPSCLNRIIMKCNGIPSSCYTIPFVLLVF